MSIESANEVQYLVDRSAELPTELSKHWGGILEPLAAGSTRVWQGKNSKEAVLVLDVGAGTTDLSLFWVAQLLRDAVSPGHRAFPITPQSDAIRVAGDHLDHILVGELLKRAHLDGVEGERKQAEASLRLSGVRRLKEELFTAGLVRYRMGNDLTVEIRLEEFLVLPGVQSFQSALETSIRTFLEKVHSSWGKVETIQLVLTGGGCDLPMVTRLAGMSLPIGGGKTVRLKSTPRVPAFLSGVQGRTVEGVPTIGGRHGRRVAARARRTDTHEGVPGRRIACRKVGTVSDSGNLVKPREETSTTGPMISPGEHCAVIEVAYCLPGPRGQFLERITRAVPGLTVWWICFENDLAQANKNCVDRNDGRDLDMLFAQNRRLSASVRS